MAGVADHAAGHDLPVAAGGWRLAAGGWRLAAHVATAATTTTGSVRFHRFFQHVALDGSKTARVVADLLGMRGKPWVVTGAKVWVTAHFFLASIRRDRWGDWGLTRVTEVAAPLGMIARGPVCGSATSIEEEQPWSILPGWTCR
ncbi:hypothetical protein, partial [Acidiphilium sp.]|uniref:hypothetical protein n=1 Tax=Acidiphilium sp. TaxID=527 RepID=UPI0025843B10